MTESREDYERDPGDLSDFIDRIRDTEPPVNVRAIQEIFCEALNVLRRAEIAVLADETRKHTGMSSTAVSETIKEARNFREGKGFLNTMSDIVEAFLVGLRNAYASWCWVGDSLYVYDESPLSSPDDDKDADTNFYQRNSTEGLEADLLAEFGSLAAIQSQNARREVLKQIRAKCEDPSFFDNAPPGLNVSNGFIHLDHIGGPSLGAHDVAHKARNKLAVAYDPSAPFDWVQQSLSRTLSDPLAQAALQEAAGAVMFNVRPRHDTERGIICLVGPRLCGKSTVIGVIEALMPQHSIASVPPGDWKNEYNRAQLEGVAVNIVTELGATTQIPGEFLKLIASRERISARHPHGRPFNFRPDAYHLFATNEVPRITDTTTASERRLLCIRYDRSLTTDEIDSDLMRRLRDEPSAFINWAAAGAMRLLHNGRFTLPANHTQTAAIMQHGDDLGMILAQTRIEPAVGERTATVDIRAALRGLAEELGIDPGSVNDGTIKTFVGEITRRFNVKRHKTNGAPFYKGIRLTGPRPENDDRLDTGLSGL